LAKLRQPPIELTSVHDEPAEVTRTGAAIASPGKRVCGRGQRPLCITHGASSKNASRSQVTGSKQSHVDFQTAQTYFITCVALGFFIGVVTCRGRQHAAYIMKNSATSDLRTVEESNKLFKKHVSILGLHILHQLCILVQQTLQVRHSSQLQR
jgi:hypothetical protein